MSFIRPGRGPVAGGAGTDPYPLYPAFDRNELPFHTASGSWGAQVPFEAPSPPVTTRQVTVTTTGDFDTEAAVDGTEITIGASFATSSTIHIKANDIDVILPNAYSTGGITIGDFNVAGKARIRIRRPTGEARGGRTGQIRSIGTGTGGGYHSDIIIDGVDNNGQSNFGGPDEDNNCFYLGAHTPAHRRIFIHNVRGLCGSHLGYMDFNHTLIANCSLRSSAVNRTTSGDAEGWGIRGYGTPLVIVDSHLETTRYHVIRPNTWNNDNEYFYLARSKIVNLSEGKIGWLGLKLTDPAWGFYWGAWVIDCDIYAGADSTCNSSGDDGEPFLSYNCTYTRIKNNRFYVGGTANVITWDVTDMTTDRNAAISVCNADATLVSNGRAPLPSDAQSSDADLATNTFYTLTGRPSWGGCGDPTGITLPNGWSLDNGNTDGAYGSDICAAIW